MIFSRNRGSDRGKDDESPRPARHAARRRERDEFGVEAQDRKRAAATGRADGAAGKTGAAGKAGAKSGGAKRRAAAFGPYDIDAAPSGVDRLDLGSLQIPVVDGVEVQLQADSEGQVQQVLLVHGASALQLGVFAAPRSEGIWDEVCDDIRAQLTSDGATAVDTDGDYGVELRARAPSPQGPTELRFVGVDGPRWLVRAVYQGPAAADSDVAEALTECLRGVVVDRGGEAMPVREALPLRLPRDVAEQAQSAEDADGDVAAPVPVPAKPAGGRRPPRRRS